LRKPNFIEGKKRPAKCLILNDKMVVYDGLEPPTLWVAGRILTLNQL